MTADPYLTDWNPREYLRQYYTREELAADDADLMRTLCGWLRERGRVFAEVIDVGCGPTLHNAFAVAPYARAIDLADYLPANLNEAQKWVGRHPDAHDWTPLFRGVMAVGGEDPGGVALRTEAYRGRLRRLLPCDLRQPHPLGRAAGYDLVCSFFCAECVGDDSRGWQQMMSHLCGLVRDGGSLFLAALRNASRYRVLDRWLPAVPIVESDLIESLTSNGFQPASIAVRTFPAPDWAEDGFEHILVATADKPETAPSPENPL